MSSLTEENYLKAIYRLSLIPETKITLTAIAEEIKVNAASAVDMIKKLGDKNLIHYNKKLGARLTAKGSKMALDIVRKHRLWEVFLLEKLNYSWDVIHEIAEQLEHIKHKELADRLEKYLGFPKYDPHGDPIPKSNGEVPRTPYKLLSEAEKGKYYRVTGVKDTSPLFLQYLRQLSVQIGTKIKVNEKINFDGSLLIQLGKSSKKTVSKKFAESLFIY